MFVCDAARIPENFKASSCAGQPQRDIKPGVGVSSLKAYYRRTVWSYHVIFGMRTLGVCSYQPYQNGY